MLWNDRVVVFVISFMGSIEISSGSSLVSSLMASFWWYICTHKFCFVLGCFIAPNKALGFYCSFCCIQFANWEMQSDRSDSRGLNTQRTQSLTGSGDTRGKHRIQAELKRLEQETRFLEVSFFFRFLLFLWLFWLFIFCFVCVYDYWLERVISKG